MLARQALDGAVRSGSRGWMVAPCPFCAGRMGTASRRCFGVLATLGFYKCFRCGVKGRLSGFEGSSFESQEDQSQSPPSFQPPEGYVLLNGDKSWSLSPARAYLEKRGICPEVIREAQLGACAYGPYVGRVVAPVLDLDRKTWLGFSARSWLPKGEVEQPYMNPSGMLKGRIFYNGALLYENPEEPLLVTEGVFDGLTLWGHAVACLGKPGPFQEELLIDCPRPIVCMLDGDAWRESEALSFRLRMQGKRAGFLKLPPGEDPSSLGKDWVLHQISQAI